MLLRHTKLSRRGRTALMGGVGKLTLSATLVNYLGLIILLCFIITVCLEHSSVADLKQNRDSYQTRADQINGPPPESATAGYSTPETEPLVAAEAGPEPPWPCDTKLGLRSCLENGANTAGVCKHPHQDLTQHFDRATSLADWDFPNSYLLLDTFPIDPIEGNFVRQVRNAIFSKVLPTPLQHPAKLVAFSQDALDLLDLDAAAADTEQFVAFCAGNTFLEGSVPLAHRYGGHQFGDWSGQLGDGRAHILGEYINSGGERWELQLKGSGKTPYSRHGDGRAVLRSSVREFLAAEAMHHLGIPTSMALSLVMSDDGVWRDQFYDGHPRQEKAAVVLRLASSWFRIGSLEILAKSGEINLLRTLVDFVIKHHFKEINLKDEDRFLELFAEIVSQTADMIASWQSVGFAHGVLNTDNFSLLSITIDYGPFGFLDEYNPRFVPNTSDDEGRYSYGKQPDVGLFNLCRLGEALSPLLTSQQRQQIPQILAGYGDIYERRFLDLFRQKLGLLGETDQDEHLVTMLLKMMEDTGADFTMTFRQLGTVPMATLLTGAMSGSVEATEHWALADLRRHNMFAEWVQLYSDRSRTHDDNSDDKRQQRMKASNPKYILRNWMAQDAIKQAEHGDFKAVNDLLHILRRPFEDQEEADEKGFASRPPSWAKDVRVSCSS